MTWHPFFNQLNSVQQEAIQTTDGPLLLLASPGSGKTTTMIMRIGYLIHNKSVKPSRIKALTFSRAAASDMKLRFRSLFPNDESVQFSTIHSLAYQVTKDFLHQKQRIFTLIEGNSSTYNKRMMLRQLFKDMNHETITEDQLELLSTYISFVKNKALSDEDAEQVACEVPQAFAIYQAYELHKQNNTPELLLDYDDLLIQALEALKQDQLILTSYQNKYDYVLIDESQDTSRVQHLIIEKLVEVHHNLCLVADDDQAIYTWRAAEPEYLLNFRSIYPQATILKMEQNYRSTKAIVEASNQIIKRNENRYDKQMVTEHEQGPPIKTELFQTYQHQIDYLVQQLHHAQSYRDIACLYRQNASSIVLADALQEQQIPFYIRDVDRRFFNHWIVRDVLNFMRLTYDETRFDLFERIYSKTDSYLSKQQLEQVKQRQNNQTVFDQFIDSGVLKPFQVKKMIHYKQTYQLMKNDRPSAVIKRIRHDLGYENVIKDMAKQLGLNVDQLTETVNVLEIIARKTDDMIMFARRLKQLEQDIDASKSNLHANAVTLSTFHSAKGLEFDTVYLLDLVQGVIPTRQDIDQSKQGDQTALEESVRLFYVGMTRAKRKLELLSYQQKYGGNVRPSSFFMELHRIKQSKRITDASSQSITEGSSHNPNAIQDERDLAIGVTIRHQAFGIGKIIDWVQDSLIIQFDIESKELALSTCLNQSLLEHIQRN